MYMSAWTWQDTLHGHLWGDGEYVRLDEEAERKKRETMVFTQSTARRHGVGEVK